MFDQRTNQATGSNTVPFTPPVDTPTPNQTQTNPTAVNFDPQAENTATSSPAYASTQPQNRQIKKSDPIHRKIFNYINSTQKETLIKVLLIAISSFLFLSCLRMLLNIF